MYTPKQRLTARRQMQVSQAGVIGALPDVLVRFREVVGVGNITGPYRGYLFYWKTTRKDAIDAIGMRLWRYLSQEKRTQFVAMTVAAGRDVAWPLDPGPRASATEMAWAAGLFDGEGSVWASSPRGSARRAAAMELAQSSEKGVPETLVRFRAAIGVGWISGPHAPRSPWSRLPQYRWAAGGRHQVSAVVHALWPWLGTVKREQVTAVREWLDPDVPCATPRQYPGTPLGEGELPPA